VKRVKERHPGGGNGDVDGINLSGPTGGYLLVYRHFLLKKEEKRS